MVSETIKMIRAGKQDKWGKIILQDGRIAYPLGPNVDGQFAIEIDGDFAMFVDPLSGSEKFSYPVPTFSAAKGILEANLFMKTVEVVPVQVDICKPIKYTPFGFNYHGAYRNDILLKTDNATQMRCQVLSDVCFRIHAYVINAEMSRVKSYLSPNFLPYISTNHAHSFQEQFNRRLVKGRNIRSTHLGWSEFSCNYCGVIRPETQVEKSINMYFPTMLLSVFNSLSFSKIEPSKIKTVNNSLWMNNVYIKEGVLQYA